MIDEITFKLIPIGDISGFDMALHNPALAYMVIYNGISDKNKVEIFQMPSDAKERITLTNRAKIFGMHLK